MSGLKIIDRYIIKKVLYTFLFVALILVAVVTIIDITERMDKFAAHKLSLWVILGYYGDFIPWLAGLITPITAFIAIIYVTSRMAAHMEIVAILSSGVSFRRLMLPYFIASGIIAVASFVLNGWIIPPSNRDRLDFEVKYFNKTYNFSNRNLHMQIQPNVYLYVQDYSNQSNTGYQFSLERFEDNRLVDKLVADNIVWDTTKNKWILRYWKRRQVDSLFQKASLAEKLNSNGYEKDTTLAITPADFKNEERKYDGMTIPELTHHIQKMRFRGSTGVEAFEVERHLRYSAPFTIFVLVLMGVIVSARKSRGGTGYQIVLGFVLAFAFIIFFTMTRTFAEAGSMIPVVAAWLPNIVFTVISAAMYKFVPR